MKPTKKKQPARRESKQVERCLTKLHALTEEMQSFGRADIRLLATLVSLAASRVENVDIAFDVPAKPTTVHDMKRALDCVVASCHDRRGWWEMLPDGREPRKPITKAESRRALQHLGLA